MGVHQNIMDRPRVRLEPWGQDDLGLLQRCLSDPAMMEHLGGPESAEKIAERQRRYERPDSHQFKVVDDVTGEGLGWVGYWERHWREHDVYEVGWSVLPAFQGRGVARSATGDVIALARSEGDRRFMHAFPSVDNPPSNGICRSLGFTLQGEQDFEYPKGHWMRCNDWRLELLAE